MTNTESSTTETTEPTNCPPPVPPGPPTPEPRRPVTRGHLGGLCGLRDFTSWIRDDIDELWHALDLASSELRMRSDYEGKFWQQRHAELVDRYASASIDLVRVTQTLTQWSATLNRLGVTCEGGGLRPAFEEAATRIDQLESELMALTLERDSWKRACHAQEAKLARGVSR